MFVGQLNDNTQTKRYYSRNGGHKQISPWKSIIVTGQSLIQEKLFLRLMEIIRLE